MDMTDKIIVPVVILALFMGFLAGLLYGVWLFG
jgi:hypothetical protein